MTTYQYPSVPGTSTISTSLPLPDTLSQLPDALTGPGPPTPGSKHIFAFWQSGIRTLPPYLLRTIVNWHCRLSPLGWTIYVLDTVPGSLLNVSNYIDTTTTENLPQAFIDGKIEGQYVAQHTSDLIRFPLILKYGGAYLDVGVLQFGDLDRLWTELIANPESPIEFAGFTMGDPPDLQIVNFGFAAKPNNPLLQRAHYILSKLWEGKTSTKGMHKYPLVSHVPLMRVPEETSIDDGGVEKMVIDDAAMTDYAIQIQCLGAAQLWLDEEDNWDGPKYVRDHCWLLSMMKGAFMLEQMTDWNSKRQFELLQLPLPEPGKDETDDQKLARNIVETLLADSWCLKLGHGFSAKLFGADTLGMLWRKHPGTDSIDGTYGGWLRWAEVNCRQDVPVKNMSVPTFAATKVGRLMM